MPTSTEQLGDGMSDSSLSLQDHLSRHGLFIEKNEDANWEETHPDHPRSWNGWKKGYSTAMIFWLEFFMTFISTSGTTAADQARKEYGISETMSYFAFVTIYLLAQAIGGIAVSPLSEKRGRRTLYIYACAVFCVFNVIIASIDSVIAVFFGRFFTGFVASIPATVAFGNFEDMYDAEQRIWIVYFYTLAGNTGLVLGPIYAAYVSSVISWRWIFYIAAIASGISLVLSFGLSESKATSLLARKVDAVNKDSGHKMHAANTDVDFTVKRFFTENILRPLLFLSTEPLVFFCATLCSIAFALFYGETESLTIVYESFGFSSRASSLSFIAVLLGLVLDILPRFWDQHVYHRHQRANKPIPPEAKIGSFAVACPALAIGLWIFGWTIPPLVTNVHWVVSMIGLVLTGFAANDFAVVLFGYITDSYGEYAASAVASLSLTRTLVAAVFPLFITQMYTGLGSNVATSILAAVATLFCFTPYLFLKYGSHLRRKSRWATTMEHEEGGVDGSEETSIEMRSNDGAGR